MKMVSEKLLCRALSFKGLSYTFIQKQRNNSCVAASLILLLSTLDCMLEKSGAKNINRFTRLEPSVSSSITHPQT